MMNISIGLICLLWNRKEGNKMNVLFVGMYPDEYSPYRNVFFQNLIYAVADTGIDCTVISPVPITKYRTNIKTVSRKRVDFTPKGAKVTVFHPRYISLSSKKIVGINTGIFSELLFQRAAIKEARRIKKDFDAVYGHFFLSGGLAAIKIGNERRISSFIANGECNYQSEIIDLYRELEPKDIEGLSGIIAVSTNNANVLKEKKELFGNIPVIIAPNSVDMSLFFIRDKKECRQRLGLPENQFIVGFVGGFVERKGDKRLLCAINSLEGVYGAFAGRGDESPKGEKVVFCEALQHEEIPIFLNAVDVFCLPTQNEGSCNAIVEAAACAKPIISSNLPFNDDLLTDDNSIRIDPNSVDEIRRGIEVLYNDIDYCKKIGEAVYQDSRQFDIEIRAQKIVNFIKRTMRNRYDKE